MKLNLSTKLLPIVIFSLLASTLILSVVSIKDISTILNKMYWDNLEVIDASTKSLLGDYTDAVHYRSLKLSTDAETINAIKNRDTATLRDKGSDITDGTESDIDTVVFITKDGKILLEVQNDSKLKIITDAKDALQDKERTGLASLAGSERLYIHAEQPIWDDGVIIGAIVVGADIFADNSYSLKIKERFHADSTIFLGDVRYGTTLVNPATGASFRGTKTNNETVKQQVLIEGKDFDEEAVLPGQTVPSMASYAPLQDYSGKIIGMRMIGVSTEGRSNTINSIITTTFVIVLAAVLIFGGINWVMVRQVLVKPIRVLTALCGRLENLDLSEDAHINSSDELGELAASTNAFVAKIREVLHKLQDQAKIVGQASEELVAAAKAIQENTVQTTNKLNDTVTNVDDMNQRSSTAKKALEDVSAGITTISTSAEEMTATIGEIAGNSSNARTITAEATNEAVKASTMIKNLGSAAQEIGTVTESISSISAQTNILALNATIEAARAGAAGKGFAVVANEIKNLAQETEEATGNIHGKVNDIQSSTSAAVGNVESVTKVITDVNSIVTSIAAAIEEQSAVTRDISNSIGNIANNIQESNATIATVYDITKKVTDDIHVVGQLAEGISAGNTQIKSSADSLATMSHELQGQVDQFKL